jgi:hypothetical protein
VFKLQWLPVELLVPAELGFSPKPPPPSTIKYPSSCIEEKNRLSVQRNRQWEVPEHYDLVSHGIIETYLNLDRDSLSR